MDTSDILNGLLALHDTYDVINVRSKDRHGRVYNKTFDTVLPAAAHAAELTRWPMCEAVWATLNPLKVRHDYSFYSARDTDVLVRRWLPLDFDPVRTNGPATDVECQSSIELCARVVTELAYQLDARPCLAFGGNSAHALYRLAEDASAPNDTLVPQTLRALADRFSNDKVILDRTNGNPSRVWKVYGTWNRKGVESPERPWRVATLYSEASGEVSAAQLRKIIEDCGGKYVPPLPPSEFVKEPPHELRRLADEIESILRERTIDLKGPKPYISTRGESGQRWTFRCPWEPEHALTPGKAFAVLYDDGDIVAGCMGNRCKVPTRNWDSIVDSLMEKVNG